MRSGLLCLAKYHEIFLTSLIRNFSHISLHKELVTYSIHEGGDPVFCSCFFTHPTFSNFWLKLKTLLTCQLPWDYLSSCSDHHWHPSSVSLWYVHLPAFYLLSYCILHFCIFFSFIILHIVTWQRQYLFWCLLFFQLMNKEKKKQDVRECYYFC